MMRAMHLRGSPSRSPVRFRPVSMSVEQESAEDCHCNCGCSCYGSDSADEELHAISSVGKWSHEGRSDQSAIVDFADVLKPVSHDNPKAGALPGTPARQVAIRGLRASPSVNSCMTDSCPGSPATYLQPPSMIMATASRLGGGVAPSLAGDQSDTEDDDGGGFVASLLMDNPDGWECAASLEPSSTRSLPTAYLSQGTSAPASKPYRPGGWTAFLPWSPWCFPAGPFRLDCPSLPCLRPCCPLPLVAPAHPHPTLNNLVPGASAHPAAPA